MATQDHPITGVKLNSIDVERKALSYKEAVTAWLLRLKGAKYNHVAQFLGTNTHRLGEVFREEIHSGSRLEAESLLH